MPTHQVNLDALIRREDFESVSDSVAAQRRTTVLRLGDLEENRVFFQLLRKPDFQRETASWSSDKIVDLVRSFLDSDLIPSVIMWWSGKSGKVFVIDGAHRLSALIAWVHDDYGEARKYHVRSLEGGIRLDRSIWQSKREN